MGCSALNSDLIRKNIVNSSRCTCGAIATPTRYLLNFPHYNIPGQRHIFSLNLPIPLSTEPLLVGSNELTINQDTDIFLSIQKIILSSKRFTSYLTIHQPLSLSCTIHPLWCKIQLSFLLILTT